MLKYIYINFFGKLHILSMKKVAKQYKTSTPRSQYKIYNNSIPIDAQQTKKVEIIRSKFCITKDVTFLWLIYQKMSKCFHTGFSKHSKFN